MEVTIDLLPDIDLGAEIARVRLAQPKLKLSRLLGQWLPNRYVDALLAGEAGMEMTVDLPLAQLGRKAASVLAEHLHHWVLRPQGTEGYRTAEVTLGGIDTGEISSKTMEAKNVPGLYFIGECVDVTGWLGGYNFQWAWASGHAAGECV